MGKAILMIYKNYSKISNKTDRKVIKLKVFLILQKKYDLSILDLFSSILNKKSVLDFPEFLFGRHFSLLANPFCKIFEELYSGFSVKPATQQYTNLVKFVSGASKSPSIKRTYRSLLNIYFRQKIISIRNGNFYIFLRR